MFFKQLSSEEEKEFRQWARDNYKVGEPISGIWHPVVQDECVKMNTENSSLATPVKEDPAHNHFGEVFMPGTCPACRAMQRNID